MNYLIDTNVISELQRPRPHSQVLAWFSTTADNSLYLSVLSLGEIRKGIGKLPDSQRKVDLYRWLEYDLPMWFGERLLPIDTSIADR